MQNKRKYNNINDCKFCKHSTHYFGVFDGEWINGYICKINNNIDAQNVEKLNCKREEMKLFSKIIRTLVVS